MWSRLVQTGDRLTRKCGFSLLFILVRVWSVGANPRTTRSNAPARACEARRRKKYALTINCPFERKNGTRGTER